VDPDNIQSTLAAAGAAWDACARAPSAGLGRARVVAHWGAQLPTAAGWTLAPPRPDHSHGSLEWVETERALVGVPVSGVRAALRLADLTLFAQGAEPGVREQLALPGQQLDAALAWLAGAIARLSGAPAPRLERPRHDLPPDPIGTGAPFPRLEPGPLAELAAWFSSADRVLRALAAVTPGASPVRCWPHHFDIATSIALDGAEAAPATARSIGVGLSPGDAGIAEPYGYVTPWPSPEVTEPPRLPIGSWHTEGWSGAVGERVVTFIAAAIPACRRLLSDGAKMR
jgi:hypothetical protein